MPSVRQTLSGGPYPKNVSIKVLTSNVTTFDPLRPPKWILWTFQFRFPPFFAIKVPKNTIRTPFSGKYFGGASCPTRLFFCEFLGKNIWSLKILGSEVPDKVFGKMRSWGAYRPDLPDFWALFSAACSYRAENVVPPTRVPGPPKGTYVSRKKGPTFIRCPIAKIFKFLGNQNRVPPGNTWSKSFKLIR